VDCDGGVRRSRGRVISVDGVQWRGWLGTGTFGGGADGGCRARRVQPIATAQHRRVALDERPVPLDGLLHRGLIRRRPQRFVLVDENRVLATCLSFPYPYRPADLAVIACAADEAGSSQRALPAFTAVAMDASNFAQSNVTTGHTGVSMMT